MGGWVAMLRYVRNASLRHSLRPVPTNLGRRSCSLARSPARSPVFDDVMNGDKQSTFDIVSKRRPPDVLYGRQDDITKSTTPGHSHRACALCGSSS